MEALLLRSRLRRRTGRTKEAESDLELVRKEGGPGLVDRTYNVGVRELQNHRSAEAERLFAMAAELDPGCVRAWLGIARCTMEAGRYAEASEALTHAIDQEPQASELYYHRANAYRVQEKWEEAFADAIRALDRDPRNPTYFVLRGIIYREYQKDHENAERDFSQALEIDPTLPSAYFERGVLYHDMRLLNDAERDLRQALARHGSPDGVIALASVLRDKGEYDKASEALRGALEIYPTPPVRKRLLVEIERTAQAKEADH
jgi:tetratricopeptide (TPR) repeat protein